MVALLAISVGLVSASYYSKGYDHKVDAAIYSKHSVSTYPVASKSYSHNPFVDIKSEPLPLTIRFNSHSSHTNAIQKHFGSHGTVQKASHIDEPDLLINRIKKPIIQEVHETIYPYRQRTQEIRPLREKIETIIAKEQHHQDYSPKYSEHGKYSGGHQYY